MENEPEVIQQQMQDTRSALSEKLETLEAKVAGTVEGVTETVANVKQSVQETVESVKETMQDAAQSVKQAFDVSGYVDEHPWLMVGGAFAVGFLGGYLLGGSEPRAVSHYPAPPWPAARESNGRAQAYPRSDFAALKEPSYAAKEPEPSEPGLLSQLGDMFGDELTKLKSLAIGTSLGLLRDMITQAAPDNLSPQLRKLVDDVTTKMGGEPIRGPVLPEEGQRARDRESLHV